MRKIALYSALIFAFTFTFLKVAINLAGLSPPKPLIVISVEPVLKLILSAESDSVVPSVLIKTYLSSSKGKNVSKESPLLIAPVEELVIVTSNCFLIVIEELVKSTLEIFLLGKGVNNVLSVEDWN